MPVGPYDDFDECLADNQDKDDPSAFCAWLERETSTVELPGDFTSAAVTLLPAPGEADRLAVDDGDDPGALHVTLAWLGRLDGDPAPELDHPAAVSAVAAAVREHDLQPVEAEAFAHAIFNPDSAERDPATVLLVQSAELTEARKRIVEAVGDASDHPTWVPHLTLGYNLDLDPETLNERTGPVVLDRIVVAYGSDRAVEIPLGGGAMPASGARHRITVPERFRATGARTSTLQTGASDEAPTEAPPARQGWEGVLIVEGTPTGDGRMMERGSLRWSDLPLPLRWAREDEGAHLGAVTVGRILDIWRDGDKIRGRGDLDLRIPEAAQLAELMADRDGEGATVSGVSADLDDTDVEVRIAAEALDREDAMFADELGEDEDPEREVDDEGRVTVWEMRSDDELFVTTDGRIRAATVVDVPAFVEARLELTDDAPEEDDDAPDVDELTAGAAPEAPPAGWFADPKLSGLTPLTVTDEGRVYGHLAPWNACHTAYANECVQPPHSAADYRYFHVGAVRTADGGEVSTGRITLDTLHAGRRMSAVDTLAHYENTGMAVADVRAGEDAHGIWIAGALRPGVDAEQVRTLRASPLSGDWRRVGGNLELVAALAVNSPGFPVPRALVASGNVVALQAAGAIPPRDEGQRSDRDAILERMIRREARAEARRREGLDRARRRVSLAAAASRVRR